MEKVKMNLIDTYRHDDKYWMDISRLHGYYEAWIYNINYGVKMLMFGTATDQISKDEFVNLAFDRIYEYIVLYQEEYEN